MLKLSMPLAGRPCIIVSTIRSRGQVTERDVVRGAEVLQVRTIDQESFYLETYLPKSTIRSSALRPTIILDRGGVLCGSPGDPPWCSRGLPAGLETRQLHARSSHQFPTDAAACWLDHRPRRLLHAIVSPLPAASRSFPPRPAASNVRASPRRRLRAIAPPPRAAANC